MAKIDAKIVVGVIAILLIGFYVFTGQKTATGAATSGLNNSTVKPQNNGDNIADLGESVTVEYTGMYENGTVFDTTIKSIGDNASLGKSEYIGLTFTLGSGQLITGFDEAVQGMQVGKEKDVFIPASNAYGEYKQELIVNVSCDQIGGGATPTIGALIGTANGLTGKVIDIKGDMCYVDFNHPLAGQTLEFVIKLLKIN